MGGGKRKKMKREQNPPRHDDHVSGRSGNETEEVPTSIVVDFTRGDLVKVHSLQSTAGRAMNGRTAMVLSIDTTCSDSRVECHVPGHPASIAIQRGCLKKAFPGYRMGDSATHGTGLFATASFSPGQTILCEQPLARDMKQAVTLSGPDWDVFTSLAQTVEQPTSNDARNGFESRQAVVAAVFNTNCFDHAGVCPVMSRANHCCDGNAAFEWDADLGHETLYAVSPIAPGDEITVPYTGDFMTTAQRQSHLMMTKGFRCDCSLCTLPQPQRDERDAKLKLLGVIHEAVPKMNELDDEGSSALQMLERGISLCEDLGTYERMLIAPFCYDAFQIFAQRNPHDVQHQRQWAERYRDALRLRSANSDNKEQRRKAQRYAVSPRLYQEDDRREARHRMIRGGRM